mgnify:CR=1 FL=1
MDKKLRWKLNCFFVIAILSILSGTAAILLAIISIFGIVNVFVLKTCIVINIGIIAVNLFKAVTFLELLNDTERNKNEEY